MVVIVFVVVVWYKCGNDDKQTGQWAGNRGEVLGVASNGPRGQWATRESFQICALLAKLKWHPHYRP